MLIQSLSTQESPFTAEDAGLLQTFLTKLGPVENHLLAGANFAPSPNFNARPENTDIDLLVLHNISLPPEQFCGDAVERFFCNTLDWDAHPYFDSIRGMCVSAHLFIRRDGSVIQFIPFDQRAWHAGASCFEDRENCNDFSIGVELEGADYIPYERGQYLALAAVITSLECAYPGIKRHRIVGHSDIAPTRKTDPGPAFDWAFLDEVLSHTMNQN